MWLNAMLSLNVAFVRNDPRATSTAGWRLACLRKYVFRNLLLQKLSRRQYLRYIFEKKAEMYFIEGRFCSKAAENFVSVLLAYNAPSICPRQNASATAYSTPNRTGQTGQAPPFVQQQHKQ